MRSLRDTDEMRSNLVSPGHGELLHQFTNFRRMLVTWGNYSGTVTGNVTLAPPCARCLHCQAAMQCMVCLAPCRLGIIFGFCIRRSDRQGVGVLGMLLGNADDTHRLWAKAKSVCIHQSRPYSCILQAFSIHSRLLLCMPPVGCDLS